MNPDRSLREARDSDLPEIGELLERSGLPTSDLDRSRPWFVVAREGAVLVGAGGLEVHGATGLVRSIVVADGRRRGGLGRALVEFVEAAARQRGLGELVLLTETARDFFARLGYVDIDRNEAPPTVRESAEFKSLCPQSANCMRKNLGGQVAATDALKGPR
jgi:amino-acid N-acetyltransferase